MPCEQFGSKPPVQVGERWEHYWLLPGQELPASVPPESVPPTLEPWFEGLRQQFPAPTPLDEE